ncbi:ATP-binding protein [Rubripirellula amarantea]|uniref:histidine kinase n=1 Tax=Rubripirellula amarantea TaxID=2527999 RepID=A0A5C5WG25_9BACT|nr:ATP-binding protein [Rubripirellula amarantea]MDA8743222.1 ATP-binding protein [Rubripirellula amarantea]TWT49487.1 Signal-transduction histidine kinase senX3 [Rubripirellula amarantea]
MLFAFLSELAFASEVTALGWILAAIVTLVSTIVFWSMRKHIRATDLRHAQEINSARETNDHWQLRLTKIQQEAFEATSALQRMREGVILLLQNGDVLLINPAARHLLDLDPAGSFHGRPIAEIVRIPDFNQAILAAAAGDVPQNISIEISYSAADQTTPVHVRPLSMHVDSFTAGTETKLLVSLRDESKSKRVDEMRREFVANISHEIKTPLAAIKGYAETVQLAISDDPDAAIHFMRQINHECVRLEQLIADMMQLARAQEGPSNLHLTSVRLSNVVAQSLASYRPVASAKEITLIANNDFDGSVEADPEATLTIVNNLIGNAIRYTPAGGTVNVGCRDAGDKVALFVSDTGIGISEVDQQRIFDRFYRVATNRQNRSGKRAPSLINTDGGTGIGLSIVKNLTQAMGGEVKVSSRPNEGSRFEVLLPRSSN